MYKGFIKRGLDVLVSGIGLMILWPVFLVVGIFIKIKLGSPIVFKQKRLGKDEKVFTMYKFRTMTDAKDEFGELLPDEIRLTKFGKTLRTTSLDELPELWNIFKGDMSLIGPRPLPDYYKDFYTEHEHKRHLVRGGLTGYAQIMGRNYVKWEKKFEQDVYYVDNCSFMLDLLILFQTIFVVLKGSNIETASRIVHEGVVYQPLNIERANMTEQGIELSGK